MPLGMPGTFMHRAGGYSHRTEATLTYNMYVEMVAQGNCIGRTFTPIVVMQASRRQQNQALTGESTQQMQQCCCSQGPIHMKAMFDKDTCTSDDTMMATVEVDMTEVKKGRINANRVSVTKNLMLRTNMGRSKYFSQNIVTVDLPGLNAGEKTDQASTASINFSQLGDPFFPPEYAGQLGQYAGKV